MNTFRSHCTQGPCNGCNGGIIYDFIKAANLIELSWKSKRSSAPLPRPQPIYIAVAIAIIIRDPIGQFIVYRLSTDRLSGTIVSTVDAFRLSNDLVIGVGGPGPVMGSGELEIRGLG